MKRHQQPRLLIATASLLFTLGLAPLVQADEARQVEVQTVVVEVDPGPIRAIDKAAPAKEEQKVQKAETKSTNGGTDKPAEEAGDQEIKKKQSEEDLRKKMRELEAELQAARNKFQEKANQQRQQAKAKAQKALTDIKLPKNPTREQCKEYVAELRKACEGRRSFSSSDPATLKLKELPAEHFDLLIDEMTNRTSLRYYANYAMREIDPEKLRERFVSSIDENPNNIGIIVMHGWVEDVRPAVIEHINNADGSINMAWFQAGVELGDPALYPKLHEITTQSRYAGQFISMLEMLPDYDLGHTVDACWRRAKEGKLQVSYSSFAAKAAEFGNVDALGTLVDTLGTTPSYMSYSSSYMMRRTNVLRFIDYRGSNKEIQAWYKANKSKLVFDDLQKRFILPEDF